MRDTEKLRSEAGEAGGGGETGLADFFAGEHRACDARWAEVEAASERGDPEAAAEAFRVFEQAMRRHLAMEEEVLFPAFEEASGMRGGPTQVMRMEHEQMRGLLGQMAGLMASGAHEEVLDQGDTLLMLIQQHNAKEEGVLYPMAEMHLSDRWGEIRDRLSKVR